MTSFEASRMELLMNLPIYYELKEMYQLFAPKSLNFQVIRTKASYVKSTISKLINAGGILGMKKY